MESKDQQTFDFLLASLNTVEDSVKNYDIKSQIVGVGYIFAINVVFTLGAKIPGQVEMNFLTVALAWGVIILPVILFGTVLYPTRKFAPKIDNSLPSDDHLFYISSDEVKDVAEHLSRVQNSDLKLEMTYEILKLSGLRDMKRRRFLRALFTAAFSFFALFLTHLLRSEDLFPF